MNVKRIGLKLAGGLMAVAVAATAMVAQTGPVAAAPPEVTASENPVVIPLNQNTKNITLNWNLGNAASKAVLTVKDNAQTPVLTQGISTATGSTPLTVTYGKTYTAQLATAANPAQTLGSPLTITTKRPDQSTNVSVTPHGTWAQFNVTTSAAAIITIEASTKQPSANGTWSNPADVAGSAATILPTTSFAPKFPTVGGSLTPNTTYYYVVRAHFSGGSEQIKTGTFKTLRRQVEVTFTSLHMIEDSDILSACDCYIYYQADGQPVKSPGLQYINSGETTSYPNAKFTVFPSNATTSILVRVAAVDDDFDWIFDNCAGKGVSPHWSNGSDACEDWSFVAKWVDVSLDGMAESKTDTYTLKADDGPIKFNVSVQVKVNYVP